MTTNADLKCGLCGCAVLPSRATLTIVNLPGAGLLCKDLCTPCAESVREYLDRGAEAIAAMRAAGNAEPITVQTPSLVVVGKTPGQPTAQDVAAYVGQVLSKPAADAPTSIGQAQAAGGQA